MIAAVRPVIARAMLAELMHAVDGSTSAKTGTAPTSVTAVAQAIQVNPGTMTSSPFPISRACKIRRIAVVPLTVGTQYETPLNRAN